MFEPNFEVMSHVTSVLTQKPPQKFGEKVVLFKSGLNTAKNISHG